MCMYLDGCTITSKAKINIFSKNVDFSLGVPFKNCTFLRTLKHCEMASNYCLFLIQNVPQVHSLTGAHGTDSVLFISSSSSKEPILLCSKVYILPIEYISSRRATMNWVSSILNISFGAIWFLYDVIYACGG